MKQETKTFKVTVREVVEERYVEDFTIEARTAAEAKAKAIRKFYKRKDEGDLDCSFGGGDAEAEVTQ